MPHTVRSVALAIFISLAVSSVAQRAHSRHALVEVAFVGCVAEGMSGHEDAPTGKPLHLRIAPKVAARLAYYSVEPGLSALAPRGWHCIDIYGSNGADVLITPQILDLNAAVEVMQKTKIDGPAVVLTFSLGFTSGREEVATVVSRVFPAHLQLVRNFYSVMDNPDSAVRVPLYSGPFPTDQMKYLSGQSLEFVTPPNMEGLGTLLAPLHPTSQPISGVQILVKDRGDCCDLMSLSVRLANSDSDLVPLLLRQAQRDSKLSH